LRNGFNSGRFKKQPDRPASLCGNCTMTEEEEQSLRAKLVQLAEEHRDLDVAILALNASVIVDQLQLTRLKKRKLQLKDQIAQIEDSFLPDIIA
jgi:hypothetical protein